MNIKSRTINLIKMIYPRYGLKDTDIILATFPKSGTTWFRFIYANLISLIELDGRVVDYEFLNEQLPASFDAHIYPKVKYNKLPRFVATHQKYDDIKFSGNKKLYIYRNPLDTMVSYWEYRKGFKYFKEDCSFKNFIRGEEYGLETWIIHYLSWIQKADLLITYEELKKDDIQVVIKVLESFSINITNKDYVYKAVERSRFNKIRKMEEENGLDKRAKKTLKKSFRFARKGTIGEWENYFDEEDIKFANNLFRKYRLESFTV